MKQWGPGDFIVLAWGGFLGGFTFLLATDFALKDAAWCITGESHCVREWVSALSGWAAALAAALTIGYLAKQAADMRRQTAAVVRDLPPIISFYDPRERNPLDAWANRLQIVNINARPILVQAISVVSPTFLTSVDVDIIDHDPIRKQILHRELDSRRMYVPGIAERPDQLPTVVEINLTFQAALENLPPVDPQYDWLNRIPVRLRIDVIVVGDKHESLSLFVERPDAMVLGV